MISPTPAGINFGVQLTPLSVVPTRIGAMFRPLLLTTPPARH